MLVLSDGIAHRQLKGLVVTSRPKAGIRTMATQFFTPKGRKTSDYPIVLGFQPFNRHDIVLAFGKHSKSCHDGQNLAGSGALVFEGEVLELTNWN